MGEMWVSWLDNQLQTGGWVAWIIDATEKQKVSVIAFSFFVLAVAIATQNPAESQRLGLWPLLMHWPWTILALGNRELSLMNAAKQQGWQILGAAVDIYSVFHNDAEYF